MLDRMITGLVPAKPHTALRDGAGHLRYEECLTRDGFDGPFTILYHRDRPHTQELAAVSHGWQAPQATGAGAPPRPLARRHYRSQDLSRRGGAPVDARVPLLFNDDVVLGVLFPDAADPVYFGNGDGDDLFFIFEGGGTLRTALGDLAFRENDLRLRPQGAAAPAVARQRPQHWLSVECAAGFGLLRQWRNEVGPAAHGRPLQPPRLSPRPTFAGPRDEGLRDLVVKRSERLPRLPLSEHSPLDVVGWDGTVYPWAFPILSFAPRVGLVHLPPTVHGTFATRGALICSFVPRPLDFHPEAIPCPYPHSSVSCDEIIFYCRGNFTSRRGVGPGQHLAPPGRHHPRPAPRRLRGQHRRARHRRAGRHARHVQAP